MNFQTIKTNAKVAGMFLDQPLAVAKFSKWVPYILSAGGAIVCAKDTYEAKKEDKNKVFWRDLIVLGFTISTALFATKGIPGLFKGLITTKNTSEAKQDASKIVKEFKEKDFGKNLIESDSRLKEILDKASGNILSFSDIKYLNDNLKDKNLEEIFKKLDNRETLELGDIKYLRNNLKDKNFEEIFKKLDNRETLELGDIKVLQENVTDEGKQMLLKLIPEPQNVTSKQCFGEIGKLSLLGLLPVVAGVAGGILADRVVQQEDGEWKKKLPNKIKEGFFQFFANIFLCNIGAGGMLLICEAAEVKNKWVRGLAMIAGICATGIFGGSAIANWMSQKIIDPMFQTKEQREVAKRHHKGLYDERKPEALDIGLHADDIATVAVLSGLKWIEPALPIMYSISGYRAGIGYRNGDEKDGDSNNIGHRGHHH